jgi:MFS superfamily sulfate permease-like transporter
VPVPGVLIVRPDAPVFYANAELVRDAIEQAVLSPAERSGLLATVGADHVFPATPAAAAWAWSVADAPTPGLGRPAGPG